MSNFYSHEQNAVQFQRAFDELKSKIMAGQDSQRSSVEERLKILDDLSEFELGRYLIVNKGMNGYWTHYVCTYPLENHSTHSELEHFLLAERPMALATQERFSLFLATAQSFISEGIRMASIPSGLMGDLLYLDFRKIKNFHLFGLDIDQESLDHALNLSKRRAMENHTSVYKRDAWDLQCHSEFDFICSSGLNIYVKDNEKVVQLYREFFKALNPTGVLVTSFFSTSNEWNYSQIDPKSLKLQQIVYQDVFGFRGTALRTESETIAQLKDAGFRDFEVLYDKAKIFPTVIAKK